MKILVVEDSPTQAVKIRFLLEEAGYEVEQVVDGAIALSVMETAEPDIVLTDMHMPNLNGLELVEAIRRDYESVPVILMTADGSESLAATALRKGAASYIPKTHLQDELLPTLESVAERLEQRQSRNRIHEVLCESRAKYVIGNDHNLAASLIQHFEAQLRGMGYSDENALLRIMLALKEAVVNAIDHGNLELDSNLRDEPGGLYYDLGQQRRGESPYREREVTMTADLSPERAVFTICDCGPGFDPSTIPDPTDPENLVRAHGRGLMLIHTFMDEVKHNESGNEITMIKHRHTPDGNE